jgi:gluconokinase
MSTLHPEMWAKQKLDEGRVVSAARSSQNYVPVTVIFISGPTGVGKTIVATFIAKHLDCPFLDADSLHSPSNRTKLATGQPLTDDDRAGWLTEVARTAADTAFASECGTVVVACSLLKKLYRALVVAEVRTRTCPDSRVHISMLSAPPESCELRAKGRDGHIVPKEMAAKTVASQFEALELPTEAENRDLATIGGQIFIVDNSSGADPEEVARATLDLIKW